MPAAVILLVWAARSRDGRRRLRRLDRSTLRSLAVLGLVFYAVTQAAQFIAIDLQPAATTSLILSLSLRAAALIAWLAVVNTALAFTLWNMSLRHLSAVESAGINNSMLIQIAMLAWIFLDEPPGTVGLLGILAFPQGSS